MEENVKTQENSNFSKIVVLDRELKEMAAESTEEEIELRMEIQDLVQNIGDNLFLLSEKLYTVYSEMLYIQWGYGNWNDYVSTEIKFKPRKARYYLTIWNWFKDCSQSVRSKVKSLGWSKVKELTGVINDENADEWIKKAKKMTVDQLSLETKRYLINNRAKQMEEKEKTQTLQELSEEPQEVMTHTQESLSRITFTLYDSQREIVDYALKLSESMCGSNKKGHLLSLICQHFCMTNSNEKLDITGFLRELENYMNIKLIGIDPEAEEIIYGMKFFDKFTQS